MTRAEDDPPDADEPDRRRAGRAWRIAGIGLVLGVALAAVTGTRGDSGAAGFALASMVGALSCGIGAAYAIVTVLVDDMRRQPTSKRRPIAAGVLFVCSAALLLLAAGASRAAA